MMTLKQELAPGTPSSGYARVYVKSDGKVYKKNDAGVEAELAEAATAQALAVAFAIALG